MSRTTDFDRTRDTRDDAITGEALALDGVRVLDLTDEKAFICGRILGDLGADVIKIEPPGGDPARRKGPFAGGIPNPELSLHWWAYNTNKRGITLNLETVDGRLIFKRMLHEADVVVESYAPGTMESWGLDYASLAEIKPDIIMTTVTPYGSRGPHSSYPAVDINIQGAGTHLYLNGDPDRAPIRVGVNAAYLHGGSEAAAATMLALYYKCKTGIGQWVDVSMQEAVITTLVNSAMAWQLTGRDEMRGGAIRQERAGHLWVRQVWECKDGMVCYTPIGGGGGIARVQAYERLVSWMAEEGEVPREITDGPWNRGTSNVDWSTVTQETYQVVENIIAAFLKTKTLEELWQKSLNEGFLVAPVKTVKDIVEANHLRDREFFERVNHPEIGREVAYPGAFAKMSETPIHIRRRAPKIGEHNGEIYVAKLGLSPQELELLSATGVI